VDCSAGFFDVVAEPSGEFVATRTYSIPRWGDRPERDSLVLSVGACSIIEP
jgi:hypothetical protein